MESMGIRYRPQTCVGTVVEDGIQKLLEDRPYGTGSYWKSILKSSRAKNPCTLTVLGNTTRVHSYLMKLSRGLNSAMSRKYNGYMTKDISENTAPDHEDCVASMEECMNIRDTYEPRNGRNDVEGVYFDESY